MARNWRTNRGHPNYNIIKIGQNIEKILGDRRRLVVFQTSMKDHQLVWKNSPEVKYVSCLSCKIFGTIFEVGEGRTLTNERENKKTNDDAQGLIFQRGQEKKEKEILQALKIASMHWYDDSKTT